MPISNSHSNGAISPNIVDPRFRESLRKHNTRLGHTEALEAYCHRLRAQAAQGAGEFVSTFATGAQAASAPQAASAQAASAQAASAQAAATGAQNARAHLAKRPRERSGPPSLEEFRVAQQRLQQRAHIFISSCYK